MLHLSRPRREGAQAELQALQGAKQDLELGQAILIDKLQQCKAENEQMVQQIDKLKLRITNSTQDYVSAGCCNSSAELLQLPAVMHYPAAA